MQHERYPDDYPDVFIAWIYDDDFTVAPEMKKRVTDWAHEVLQDDRRLTPVRLSKMVISLLAQIVDKLTELIDAMKGNKP